VVNRYAILENLQEVNQASHQQYRNQYTNVKKTISKAEPRSKLNKILIIGDSHARNCAENLLHKHRESFEVNINVMPGAGQHVTQTAKNEIKRLNSKECVIIWGGSQNISKNESSTGLKHIMNFALQNHHTNIIIPALHRHDLVESSCINNEIKGFNRKLSKMTKSMAHVVLPDLTLDRKDYSLWIAP
jgi:hypothetical protein